MSIALILVVCTTAACLLYYGLRVLRRSTAGTSRLARGHMLAWLREHTGHVLCLRGLRT